MLHCFPLISIDEVPSMALLGDNVQFIPDIHTLVISQDSDTVTNIFKYNNHNTIKSLRLLKMA